MNGMTSCQTAPQIRPPVEACRPDTIHNRVDDLIRKALDTRDNLIAICGSVRGSCPDIANDPKSPGHPCLNDKLGELAMIEEQNNGLSGLIRENLGGTSK